MTGTEILAYVSAAITWGIVGLAVGYFVGWKSRT